MSSPHPSLLAVVLCLTAGCYEAREASLGDLDDPDFEEDSELDGGARDGGHDRDGDDDDERRDGGYRWLCAFEPRRCY